MILLFDLDHTLLDIERFKKDKSAIFGLTPGENERQGEEFFKKKGLNYNPEKHIEILRKSGHIKTDADEQTIKDRFQELLKNTDNYLFPDAEETLAYLKKKGYKMILMTKGDLTIQKPKVDNSRIKKYFEEVIYEEKDKSQNNFLKKLAKAGENVLIINDRAEQSLAMQEAIGEKAKIFLVDGPYSKNIEHKEKIYDSIKELRSIL